MRSPAHDSNGARSNEAGPNGPGLPLTPVAASDDATDLLTAVGTLVASQSLGELAASAAKLAEKLFEAEQAVVVLGGPDGMVVGGHPSPGSSLEAWARDLLSEDVFRGPTRKGQLLAVGIDAREAAVRGVLALELRSVVDDELGGRLVELGHLVSTCNDQMVTRVRSARALKDAQASLAKGLHDLRTPLNSLRLGMHLLEPALAGQDPAIVQRTHRAVDRMATLVTEMFDALHKN